MFTYCIILLLTLVCRGHAGVPTNEILTEGKIGQILDTVKISARKLSTPTLTNCSSEERCWCGQENNLIVVDCTRLNLTFMPSFSSDVNIVDLKFNQIVTVTGNGSLPQGLVFLDLSNNKLKSFTGDPFRHLVNLIMLRLNDNDLSYTPDVYPDYLFRYLSNLSVLNIEDNKNKEGKQGSQYPKSICYLHNLVSLSMDGLHNASVTHVIQNLTQLRTLDLSGNGQCSIDHLDKNFFNGVANSISEVNLSKCEIRYIENGTFRALPNLEVLRVSRNMRMTFKVLRNLTYDLQFTHIRKLFLDEIHCKYGVGTFLFHEDFIFLNHTSLEELYLDYNRLEQVEDTLFRYLPNSLKYLSVKANKFTFGRYLIYVNDIPNLEHIDFSLQANTYGENWEKFQQCYDWRCPTEYGKYHKKYVPTEIEMNWDSIVILRLPPKLKFIYGHSSAFRNTIGKFTFQENNSVKYIDAHNNLLTSWIGPVQNLHDLEFVDLSHNNCNNVTTHFFDDGPKLLTLNISYNSLGEVLNNDKDGDIFKNLSELENLNMTDNKIVNLPRNIFRNMHALRRLDISSNQLESWDVRIGHMQQLEFLNISYNHLMYMQKFAMDEIDQISKTSTNLAIDLRGNPLRCDCNKLNFLKWIKSRDDIFLNLTVYECFFENETKVSFSQISDIISRLEKNCSNYIGLIAGTAVIIVFCISIILCALVYRFRWKIRYLYYMARNRYKDQNLLEASESRDSQYQYDAFVSYSDKNSSFVIDELLKNLEDTRGLRLCLHQRDFLPGSEIAANITNAIHNSRKTVAIITNNYLDSYWCMFEFNMARMESVYTRSEENVLFLVLYEKLARRQFPMDMLDIIESDSYIEYPDDHQGYPVFWSKIEEAICS